MYFLQKLLFYSLFYFPQETIFAEGTKILGNSENLLKSLFKNYDKRIRPYADNGTAVIVHMTIVLGILIELRENEQVAGYVISHTQ
uniref:Neurotransmitter-gated ion-channel ligand-binding domain-containing protein n=1 Tax=Acrobeloides nanus TaxID=290746 RepID=A0A914EM45_9BILA